MSDDVIPWSGRCGDLVDSAYTINDAVFSVRCNRLLVTWILVLSFTFFYFLLDSAYPYAGDDADDVFSARCNRLLVTWILVLDFTFFYVLLILLLVVMIVLCSGQDATSYW